MYTSKTRHAFPGPEDTLRQTLPNGITVLARENFDSPSVVVEGYIEAGNEDEPHDKAGLANFATDVMERGTQHRSFEQLYEEVESVGASFGVGAGTHITSFGAKGLVEQLPLLLDVLNDVLRYPAFPVDQMEHARREILTDLREEAHDTRDMAAITFHELAYPESHPYHYNASGYPETIAAITRDDLTAFHRRYFSPQGMTLVVVGAVKAEKAVEAIAEVFGSWEATRPERVPLPTVPTLTEIAKKYVAIPEKTQSDLILGWPGPERRDPDFLTCNLANTVLGIFGMMGRLGERVRSQNGLAYYAYSRIEGGKGPGPWNVAAGVNPTNVDHAIELILEEIRRIREERIPAGELTDSKTYLTGSLPLRLETNEGVAQMLTYIERNALGLDYLQRYPTLINEITPLKAQEAVRRWLDPDHYALAIAGPPL
ncbi:MAG: pitrilysin family protein [Anaerolineae bacterium]|jgi:zinc protease|nr:pitrilysin family protein [Anaerolineae bacterium]